MDKGVGYSLKQPWGSQLNLECFKVDCLEGGELIRGVVKVMGNETD
jgi:hypothetical protein